MKKLLFVLLLFIGFTSFAQTYPTGYTGINSRYDWLSGKFRGLHAPSGNTPALSSGQWSGAGALYVDTLGGGIGLYYYNGLNWIRLMDTTEAGGGTTDTAIISTKARVMQVVDSLSAAGWPPRTLQQTLTTGSVLTGANSITGNDDLVLSGFVELDFNASQISITGTDGGASSQIGIAKDSITLKPLTGKLNIDSLRKKADPLDRVVTWNERTGVMSSMAMPNPFADLTTSIIDEQDKYNGFPWPIQKGDTTMVFVPQFTEHVGPGPIRVFKSQTGGRKWTLQGSIRVDGTTLSITSLQVGLIGDTMHLAYTRSTSYDTIFFAKNYGGGLDYTSTGYVKYTTSWTGSPAINNIFTMVSDTVYSPQYELDADSSRAFLCYYTGGVWYRGNTVLLQPGGGFPNGRTSEWSLVITQLGTFDATTKAVTLHRNEDYGYYTHVTTSNGFATTSEDVTNFMYEFGTQETRAPVTFYMQDSTVYIICGNRRTTGMFAIEYTTISASSFFTNTQSAYSKVRKLYSGSAGLKAAGEDFGYPMVYIYNGKPYLAFYDVSPVYHAASEIGEDDVRSVSFPLLDRGYSEKYNDANQSISASTQTLITYPDLLLDCMGSWDFDGDANTTDSVWEAKEDGWYMINAIATFEANSTGTYRQMYAVVVDPGENSTTTNQLVSKTTIPGHVSNIDFNRVECNGMAYIKTGEQVKVFVKHDASASLNLLNTSKETRATVKITLVR